MQSICLSDCRAIASNRIKGTAGGVTTTYIGNYFEWTGSTSTMKKYYYVGAVRIGMKAGATLSYLLSDHLGSTTITTNSSGAFSAELRYKPVANNERRYSLKKSRSGGISRGELRNPTGTTPTTFRFTGQREQSEIGLYFYNARWYDSSLGRFTSPDTIIPGAGNPLAWDRFAYTLNNPVRYTDPSGHASAPPMHDYDGDRPENYHPLTKPNSKQPVKPGSPQTRNNQIADTLSDIAYYADVSGAVLAGFEASVADLVGGMIITEGCSTGVGCGPALLMAWAVDFGISTASPFAVLENAAGFLAMSSTSLTDIIVGNTSYSQDRLSIGNDTLVSTRNFLAGLIPEANLDALVSFSQLKYDLDRRSGNKPGGSFISTGTDLSDITEDTLNLYQQFFFADWW